MPRPNSPFLPARSPLSTPRSRARRRSAIRAYRSSRRTSPTSPAAAARPPRRCRERAPTPKARPSSSTTRPEPRRRPRHPPTRGPARPPPRPRPAPAPPRPPPPPTPRISAKSVAPVAPPKKRSLVLAGVAVVVVLAAGGAWVALNGGSKASPPGPANPTDTVKHVAPDTAANSPTGQPHVVPQPPTPPTNRNASNGGGSPKPRIDVAHAFDALDNLMLNTLSKSTAVLVRDSALAFYNAPGIGQKDKAYAAFVVGHAFFELNDRPTGCRYIRTAVDLDPANTTYPTVLGQCPS